MSATSAPLGPNYQFFLDYVATFPGEKSLRILDYGCGAGQVVAALRDRGFDCVGCDIFEAGGHKPPEAGDPRLAELYRHGQVHAIEEGGSLPYAAGSFDLILSNMVFEHVRDFDTTLERLAAILAPGGVIRLHFPTREVWREGHIGIPFAHWFAWGSRWRRPYLLAFRRLGIGLHSHGGPEEWVAYQMAWLDRYCHYRSDQVIRRSFARHFEVRHDELSYLSHRARRRPMTRFLLRVPGLAQMGALLFRRLAFSVFELRHSPGGK